MLNYFKTHAYKPYTLMVVFLAVFFYNYELLVSSIPLQVIMLSLYYIISLLGVYSFYKTDKPSNALLIITVLSSFVLLGKLYLLLPLVLLFFCIANDNYRVTVKAIAVILLIVLMLFSAISLFYYNFSIDTEAILTSPNNRYNLIKVKTDQGSLGIDYSLKLERDFKAFKIRKHLILLNGDEQLSWVSNNEVKVNNDIIKVNMLP